MDRINPEIASLLLESSADVLWMIDTAGRRVYMNRAFEKILGYSSEECEAMESMNALVHPEDAQRLHELYARAVAQRSTWQGEVFRWLASDGTYRWLESNGNAAYAADGTLIGFCGADRDITARLEQEHDLVEGERRFRTTFDSAGVGIAHLSIDGHWLRVNEHLCRMLGYAEAELLALDFRDMTHPDDVAATSVLLERLLAGEILSYTIDKRYRRKDGSYLWAAATSSLVRDAHGRPAYRIAVIRDITDRIEAQEALRRSEEDYRTLFDHSNDALLVIDAATRTIVAANREAESMYMRSHDALVGTSIHDLTCDSVKGAAAVDELFRGAEMVRFETAHRRSDDTFVDLEVTLTLARYGGRRAVLAANRDVTDRNHLVHELEKSEVRFRSLVEHGYDIIAIIDSSGVAGFVSGSVEESLGYTPQELVGTSILALLQPDDRERIGELLASIAATNERKRTTHTLRALCKDGSWRWFEATSANMLDVPGVDGIVLIAHDVTEQMELAEQLEQSRRVDSLGRVAATVAHEINNALMVVQPASELLLRKHGGDPHIAKLARQVLAGVQRSKRVTQQILRFASPAAPSISRVLVRDWLAAIEPELQMIVGSRITLAINCANPALAVEIDADQLHQLVTNLISNSRDALPHGGRIEITAAAPAPGLVEIAVRDNGPGIPPEIVPRLFEPLFTTKPKGTGIGLPLCQQIMRAHGGEIVVDSEVGAGTAVILKFRVPVAADRPSILIVDDDEGVAEALRFMLEDAGYHVHHLPGATGVLHHARAQSPNLILLDLQLGDADGRDVYAELRRNAIDVPVILMSGQARIEQHQLDERASFIAKPFDVAELLRVAAQFG